MSSQTPHIHCTQSTVKSSVTSSPLGPLHRVRQVVARPRSASSSLWYNSSGISRQARKLDGACCPSVCSALCRRLHPPCRAFIMVCTTHVCADATHASRESSDSTCGGDDDDDEDALCISSIFFRHNGSSKSRSARSSELLPPKC